MAYQLILLGPMAADAKKNSELTASLQARVAELGLDPQVDFEVLISPDEGTINWTGAPVAAWLGKPSDEGSESDRNLLDGCLAYRRPYSQLSKTFGISRRQCRHSSSRSTELSG